MMKEYLSRSQAGLRFIAQTQLYNAGNFERLQTYLVENYDPSALNNESVKDRLEKLESSFAEIGRVRVKELINADKHRTVMILETEKAGAYYVRLKVSEDYPHLITQFILRPHG